MTYTDILYDVDNFIATITLNRPDKLNAWTSEMDADVRHAIDKAAVENSVRAIVLTGAGRGFCAGADMSRLSKISAGQRPSGNVSRRPRQIRQLRAEIQLYARIRRSRFSRRSTARSRASPSVSACTATFATWPRVRS